MRPFVFIALSFLVGYLSLSQEIVWVRVVSLAMNSVPQAFSFVLLSFVGGIALGSLLAAQRAKQPHDKAQVLGSLLLVSGLTVMFSPLVLSAFSGKLNYGILGLLIVIPAALKGAVFPLLHHYFSVPGPRLGRTLSLVYAANIAGSTLGPALTGFWALDSLPSLSLMIILGVAEVLLAVLILPRWTMLVKGGAIVAVLVTGVLMFGNGPNIMKRMLLNSPEIVAVTNLIENRHGLIHTIDVPGQSADLIYGGNVYDGAFNYDLLDPINGIDRVYLLAALNPKAERVLVIGLSSGSWLQVVRMFPHVKRIDVVELNPAYIDVAMRYEGAATYLDDPRVHVHFMDGRQWLKDSVRAGRQFDLIVMNTTWHWKAYTSNLLSIEFLSMVAASLSPNGVTTFNTTGSYDAFFTGQHVFPEAVRYSNFVYGSFKPLLLNSVTAADALCSLKFELLQLAGCGDVVMRDKVERLAAAKLVDWASQIERDPPAKRLQLITDSNMLTEYKHGRGRPSLMNLE